MWKQLHVSAFFLVHHQVVHTSLKNAVYGFEIAHANKHVIDKNTYQLHDEDQYYALQEILCKNVHIKIFYRIIQTLKLQTITDTGITGYVLKFNSRYSKRIFKMFFSRYFNEFCST